ncbi:MAG: SGNH/GDSL hydrolase family protein [Calditrichia bacterium]
MNKAIALLTIILLSFAATAQTRIDIEEYVNLEKYREANMKLGLPSKNETRVVFMGNSITEAWGDKSPEFFKETGYINRGICGQVTHQMLLRFRADVIDLKPRVVVILAGTNDIAQNSGFVPIEGIAENIMSMAELADCHGIKVVISSVLPAIDYPWRPGLEPAPKIIKLNEILKKYAADKKFIYVDYYSKMVDKAGGLKVPDYTSAGDLVHPNRDGYKVMEGLVKAAIARALEE